MGEKQDDTLNLVETIAPNESLFPDMSLKHVRSCTTSFNVQEAVWFPRLCHRGYFTKYLCVYCIITTTYKQGTFALFSLNWVSFAIMYSLGNVCTLLSFVSTTSLLTLQNRIFNWSSEPTQANG